MPFMSDDFQTVSSIFLDVLLVHYEMHQGNTKWVSVCFDSVCLTQVNTTNKYICAFIVMVFCLM